MIRDDGLLVSSLPVPSRCILSAFAAFAAFAALCKTENRFTLCCRFKREPKPVNLADRQAPVFAGLSRYIFYSSRLRTVPYSVYLDFVEFLLLELGFSCRVVVANIIYEPQDQ